MSAHEPAGAPRLRRAWRVAALLAALSALSLTAAFVANPEFFELLRMGDARRLTPPGGPPSGPSKGPPRGKILLIALDGVGRDLLYDMLRTGELPGLGLLLARDPDGAFPHAHFDDRVVSVLPSLTIPAWSSIFTGKTPAEHGVTGNEMFLREERRFVAPIPMSVTDPSHVLSTYTDGQVGALLRAPTIYQQIQRKDPDARLWVSMSQVFEGADLLLTADRKVLGDAFTTFLAQELGMTSARALYEELDEEVTENVIDELEAAGAGGLPDVLTLYICGADHYAHSAEGPSALAQREYLRDVIDPALARIHASLTGLGALRDRWVVVTADHGHADLPRDELHSLLDEAPLALQAADFRVRPPALDEPDPADYQAVLAHGDAVAYVYLADRSTCPAPGSICDWTQPPRLREDVLAAADAYFRANQTGLLRGGLELVLAREPLPFAEIDRPFQVYTGHGRLEPLEDHLARHPRPGYVAFEQRLRGLAVGRFGERAGDVLLIARHGAEPTIARRFYFARPQGSGHGGPSHDESEVPLVLARRGAPSGELAALVQGALGPDAGPVQQHRISELLLRLRSHGGGRSEENLSGVADDFSELPVGTDVR